MQRKNFKRIDDSLAFNTEEAEPIFKIVQEVEDGYFYFLKTTPYGDIKFVWKELVAQPDEAVEETKEKKSTKELRSTNSENGSSK